MTLALTKKWLLLPPPALVKMRWTVAYVFKTELDFPAKSRTKKLPTPPAVLVCDDENHVLVDLLLKVCCRAMLVL